MKVKIFCLICLLSCITGAERLSNTTEITIPQGKLRGTFNLLGTYRRFLGIPYASVKGRFQDPDDPPKWKDTYNAIYGSIRCKQNFRSLGLPIGRENCLVLNVYTPLITDTKLLPVMVFIHGGGYYWGSSSHLLYNPKYLVKQNVVVVTINYRIGAFGFLCLRNKGAPGNVGLKDQKAALKWVKNNINYFGGNPEMVTLFGESVGAASVNYLIMNPSTNHLFQRAILQSGSALMPQAFDANPIKSASKVAAKFGYNSTDPDELLEIFNKVSANDLIRLSNEDQTNDPLSPYTFRPCIEAPSKGALITAHPRELLRNAKLGTHKQIILGYNNREGIKWASHFNNKGLKDLSEDLTSILPDYLTFTNELEKLFVMKEIKRMYFPTGNVSTGDLIEYFSDALIAYPVVAATENLLKYTEASVYNYYFKYDSYRNLAKMTSGLPLEPGANHGDELFYLFEPLIFQALPTSSDDTEMIDTMTKIWAYFAENGNTSKYLTQVPWMRSKPNKLNFLEIDRKLKLVPQPNEDRIDFWKKLYENFGKR